MSKAPAVTKSYVMAQHQQNIQDASKFAVVDHIAASFQYKDLAQLEKNAGQLIADMAHVRGKGKARSWTPPPISVKQRPKVLENIAEKIETPQQKPKSPAAS